MNVEKPDTKVFKLIFYVFSTTSFVSNSRRPAHLLSTNMSNLIFSLCAVYSVRAACCVSQNNTLNIFVATKYFWHRLYIFRAVHVLRGEPSRHRDLQLCVRAAVHPQQLQGGAAHHQDCGGGEALHSTLRSSWRMAKTLRLLDDSGEMTTN